MTNVIKKWILSILFWIYPEEKQEKKEVQQLASLQGRSFIDYYWSADRKGGIYE